MAMSPASSAKTTASPLLIQKSQSGVKWDSAYTRLTLPDATQYGNARTKDLHYGQFHIIRIILQDDKSPTRIVRDKSEGDVIRGGGPDAHSVAANGIREVVS